MSMFQVISASGRVELQLMLKGGEQLGKVLNAISDMRKHARVQAILADNF
jgi:hypothetical protein